MNIKELVVMGEKCQVPEALLEPWMRGTGQENPLVQAFSLEKERKAEWNLGRTVIAISLMILSATAGAYVASPTRIPGLDFFVGLGLIGGVFGIVSHLTAFLRRTNGPTKDAYSNVMNFAGFLCALSDWTHFEVTELPRRFEELEALARMALVNAARDMVELENTDQDAPDYLLRHGDLHAEFTRRHNNLVLAGLAVPDWRAYFKDAQKQFEASLEAPRAGGGFAA